MRRFTVLVIATLLIAAAVPAAAVPGEPLDGPDPAIWLSDPDGIDGDAGTEQGDPVIGSSGTATVHVDGARVRVTATGLEPGHVYTMWLVYFNDHTLCIDGCNGPDLPVAGGGVLWADGRMAGATGTATFKARLASGDGADTIGETPPPPFAFAAYAAGADNEFHVVIRSHGPKVPGEIFDQLTTFGGGCLVEVGPMPAQMGDFPVPSAPGECGDVQLYVFS